MAVDFASLEGEASHNLNISAYRVLFILLLLVRHRSLNLVELNRFLCENPLIGRGYNSDTLTKYMNTLRALGCRIPRSTSRNEYRYELLKNPFPFALEPEALQVLRKLSGFIQNQPDELFRQDFNGLLNELAWFGCFECDGQEATGHESDEEMFSLWDDETATLYHEFQQYCKDGFMLQVWYQSSGIAQPEVKLIEPYEVSYCGDVLYLLALDTNTHQQERLEVKSIVQVKQTPNKNRRPPAMQSVVFALYGRLAHGYRPYPGEKIIFQDESEIRVKVRLLESSALIDRLMKYGENCEILSPKPLRELVLERIEKLLSRMG